MGDLDDTFIAMNGDILTTLDYAELVRHHRAMGAALTVATHAKQVDIDLGVIEHDGDFITGYREKPTLHYDVSMGIYVYEPRALEYLPAGPCPFPDLVHILIGAGEKVAVHRTDDDWFDIGTIPEYERAVAEMEARPEAFRV